MKKRSVELDGTYLELDGKIYIVAKKNGRVTKREEIDGKTVLDAIIAIVREEVDRRTRKFENDRSAKA